MKKIYVSIEEAAELEDISYEGMKKSLQRNNRNFVIKVEKNPDGGRDRVMVLLESLSPKARRRYKKLHPDKNEIVISKQPEELPWYVDVDFNWYKTNNEKQYKAALGIKDNIKVFLDYDEDERTSFAQEFANEMGISQRTLYRYAESYLEAEKWSLYKFKETGYNYEYFKVLAFCRKPRDANTFPSLTPGHRAFIENVWFDKEFSQNLGTVEMLYSQFETFFKKENIEYPSYKTVARYIRHLMTSGKMSNAKYLAERGEREYKRAVMIKGRRDSSTVPVLGIIQGDSHTFDFWVKYRDPNNGNISAIKPTMVAWLDTRSRVIMGDVWGKNINSQTIKQSIAKVIFEYGVPECILIDNGKDYTSKEMTGRSRKDRHKLLVLDDDAIGFYRSMGILDDYRALPYQAWVKIIERFFSTVCQQFSKWFASYTGTLTGSKTSAKVKKDVDKLLKADKLLSMEEAYEMWRMWLTNIYHQKPHRGLQEMKEKWTKPIELFENAENRIELPKPAPELVETLLLKPSMARVYPTGINKLGNRYMNYELATYAGEKLPIRYDPEDMSKIYVFDKEGKKICVAEAQELLQYQGHITETQLEEHMKLQKKQLRDDRLRLKVATTPYELRGYEGDPLVTGKLNLMIEKQKVEAIECQAKVIEEKIVDINAKRSSEYFEEKAKETLRKIKKLS